MEIIVNHIGGLASLIGSLTVVGSALIWIYNKFIAKPREERREKREHENHVRTVEIIAHENKPLVETINKLNKMLEQSQKDREGLNNLATKNTGLIMGHSEKIDELDNRVVVLETHTGVRYKKGGD